MVTYKGSLFEDKHKIKVEIHFINGSFIGYESDNTELENFSKDKIWISKGDTNDIWVNPDNVLYVIKVK